MIYLSQCSICCTAQHKEDTYVGQTQQPLHKRINGHRACFVDDPVVADKSALALHALTEHPDDFNINIFNFMILDKTGPCDLNRREAMNIDKLRTNVRGLNRMNIQK